MIAVWACKGLSCQTFCGIMPTYSEFVLSMRKFLLSLDWQTRHAYWRKLAQWSSLTAERRKNLQKLKKIISSADLLEGEFDGVAVPATVVIPLRAPPKPRGTQLKITDFFKATPRKPKQLQLKITAFFKSKR